MALQNTYSVACPHCLEYIQFVIDETAGSQEYTEDCEVCCHPILVKIVMDGNKLISFDAVKENQ